MRRTRHVVLPVKSWQYMGLMVVSLACLTLGLVSRDRGGRSGSLAGPELKHTAPHEVDACPNLHPFVRMSPYDESALKKGHYENSARALIRVRGPGTSNHRVSRSSSVEPLENGSSMIGKATRDRRLIIADRRIRTTETSRVRTDRSSRHQASMSSRILEVREKPRLLSREKRSEIHGYRSGTSDRRARESNAYLRSLSDRSIVSRTLEPRERSDSLIRQRKTNVRNHRSSPNDRRSRDETSDIREVYSERQRLMTSQSRTHRFSEIREDRVARSRSDERKSFDRRTDDSDRREKSIGVLRRPVRSVDGRDNREDRSSQISRSRNNLAERRTDRRTPENQGRRSYLVTKRSTDFSRIDARRSGIRSQERASTERREINQIDRRDRLADRSSTGRSVSDRRSRSEDTDRVNFGKTGVRLQERRFVKQNGRADLSKRSQSQERRTDMSERREMRVNILASSSPIDRQPSRRNTDRVDVRRMRVRSEERSSAERREVNQRQRQKVRVDLTIRSRDVQQTRSPRVDRLDARRVEVRSQERRIVAQPDLNRLEQTERKIGHSSVRRVNQDRQVRLTDRSQIHRSVERREPNRLERRPLTLLAPSEERRTSRSDITGQRSWMDSLRRNVRSSGNSETRGYPAVRSERFARDISRERQTSRLDGSGRRFSTKSLGRNSRSVETVDSERRERLLTRDISQERSGRSAERAIVRELRTSEERRGASAMRERSRLTSGRDSLRRDIRISRNVSEGRERLGARDISQEIRGRLTAGAITRELRMSDERRGASGMTERRLTSGRDSLRRNVRSSRTVIESRERLATRDISQGSRGRLVEDAITRELRTSRASDRVEARRERKTMEIRASRGANNREIINERLRMSFTNIPDLRGIRGVSKANNTEYLYQAIVLVLCAVYGASMLKGKGGFYGFRNIVNQANRFVVW